MEPVPIPFPTPAARAAPPRGRVAVVAPHPDDEVVGVGGTIALHRRAGDPVRVLVVTDGRAGNVSKRESQEQYVARRRAESRAAAAILGGYDLTFWDYPDNRVITPADVAGAAVRIEEWLRQDIPDVVYTPWAGESNADHRAVGLATIRALRAMAFSGTCYGYEVYCPSPADVVVDITPVESVKRAAIACFVSQLAETAIDHIAFGFHAARSLFLPKGARYGEGLLTVALDAFRDAP